MLPEYLMTVYRNDKQVEERTKLAEKLKQFPVAELMKLAEGDPTSKLACMADSMSSSTAGSWLTKYQGTPLFEKAVELEKQLVNIEAQDQQRRQERRADDQLWDARDSIRLQKRMLDLDLAMHHEGLGAGGSEAKEEQGVQMLEQAQAAERMQGGGGEPHEQAEDAAIQQFRQAQSQEAAAKQQQPGQGEKPKKPSGGMSVEVKQASAQLAPVVEAGRFLAKQAGLRGSGIPTTAALAAAGGAAGALPLALMHRRLRKLESQKPGSPDGTKQANLLATLGSGLSKALPRAGAAVTGVAPKLGPAAGLAKNVGSAITTGGVAGGAKALGQAASPLLQRGAQFAQANPLAAAGLAGGAGLALGRATAPNGR